MNVDPTGTFFLACLIVGLIIGAIAGAVIGGVQAAEEGYTGWDLVGAIFTGMLIGGAFGAMAGALVGLGGAMIGSGLSAISGAGGLLALAGGGTAAAAAAAGVASVGLGVAVVGGGLAIAGLGVRVVFAKGEGPRLGHNQHEKQMWGEALRQLGLINNKDLASRIHQKLKKYPYNSNLTDLINCIKEILKTLKH